MMWPRPGRISTSAFPRTKGRSSGEIGRRGSLRGPSTIHLRVSIHYLRVADPVDVLADLELVFRFELLKDLARRGVPLVLRDRERGLPSLRLERGNHLRAIEDHVAHSHVPSVDDRLPQEEDEVVLGREDERAVEREALDFTEAFLQHPVHGSLASGEESLHEPPLPLEPP